MSTREWGLLGLLSVLWGGSFLFMRVLAFEMLPLTVVFGRVTIAALILGGVLVVRRQALPRGRALWLAFAGMGVLNNVIPFSLLVWGEARIPAGLAAIVNATTPVFSILVAHVFTTDDRLTRPRIVGIVLGLAGVVVLMAPEARLDGRAGELAAIMACLVAAISYGFANTFGRRFRALNVAPQQVAFGQVTASAVLTLPAMLLVDRPWTSPAPSSMAWAALLALGIFSTGTAYLIFFRLLASAGAVNVSLVTLLVPVSAVLLGALALGEWPGPAASIGMVLIASGLLVINGRLGALRRRFAARPSDAGSPR